jgi:hypothetical protein
MLIREGFVTGHDFSRAAKAPKEALGFSPCGMLVLFPHRREEAASMSRKEVVLLVSRALAMIQLISAFIEITTLPDRLVSLHHYADRIGRSVASPQDFYFQSYDQVGIAFLFARVAVLLLFAFLFWNCGPWVERILLPKTDEGNESC